MKIKNFLIGSDIEWFLKKDNEIISAEGLVKGTKHEPFHFNPGNRFYATSLDNVLFEGNIPPTDKKEEFVDNINYLRNYMQSTLPEGIVMVSSACETLNEKYITEHALIAGCDSSISIWHRDELPKPELAPTLRTAGFHVHLSFETDENDFFPVFEQWILAMDLFNSIPAIIEEPFSERKKYYGKPSDCRISGSFVGGEYRALSGWWTPKADVVFDRTIQAINWVNEGNVIDREENYDIYEAIMEQDREKALNVIEKYSLTKILA